LGLSSTTDKQKEAVWRVEFEALGEQLVFKNATQGAIYNDEAKRQAALGWLSERDRRSGGPLEDQKLLLTLRSVCWYASVAPAMSYQQIAA
jgi:hypothetical protein